MKKITKFAMALIVAIAAFACSKEENRGAEYLDVTYNNIAGVWSLQSFDNGVELGEGTYRYLVLDRKEQGAEMRSAALGSMVSTVAAQQAAMLAAVAAATAANAANSN